MEFLRRNRVLLSSTALMGLSLFLVSAGSRAPDRRDPLARFLLDGLFPFQAAVTWVWTGVEQTWDHYVDLVDVKRENERLRERVARLEQELIRVDELEAVNRRLQDLLQFRAQMEGPVYGARVIGRDPLPWSRTFTIDRGRRDGIRKGMAALSTHGVVGQLTDVGWISSRVLLLTDHNSGIDAVVQRSRARGVVEGALQEGCRMKYLRRGADVREGDQVVTSGLDGIFPPGMPIGKVVNVSRRHRGLLQAADVQPSAPLDRIEEVLIVEASPLLFEPPGGTGEGPG